MPRTASSTSGTTTEPIVEGEGTTTEDRPVGGAAGFSCDAGKEDREEDNRMACE